MKRVPFVILPMQTIGNFIRKMRSPFTLNLFVEWFHKTNVRLDNLKASQLSMEDVTLRYKIWLMNCLTICHPIMENS